MMDSITRRRREAKRLMPMEMALKMNSMDSLRAVTTVGKQMGNILEAGEVREVVKAEGSVLVATNPGQIRLGIQIEAEVAVVDR